MNRLVRIALTLFAAATLLVFLVLQRLQRAKEAGAGLLPDDALSEFARNEEQMAHAGLVIAGVMIVTGVGLLVYAFVRSRKRDASHG